MLRSWGPAVGYMALIFTISSIPLPALPLDEVPFKDKGIHFIEYGVLGFLVMRACAMTWSRVAKWRVLVFAVSVTVLWGLLDELHQAYVPNRSAELLDLLADSLGALAGASAAAIMMGSAKCRQWLRM